MRKTFIQLKKNCKKDSTGLPRYRLAVLGDCATQHLATALKGQAYDVGVGLDVFEADYDQIFAQVADAGSELYAFAPDGILIYMCAEKLYETFCNTELQERGHFAESIYAQITKYWSMIGAHTNASVLQFNFIELDDKVFGNYAGKTEGSFLYQIRKLNCMFMQGAQEHKNVFPVDLAQTALWFGLERFRDPRLYYAAKMPLSMEALPAVAAQVLDVICAIMGRIKKCIILDLDNTLWGGVIGDDGLAGIQIGELGMGHAFSDFQMWIRELGRRGIILAVCSKNEEETAKEPFEKHNEMVLRLDDIAVFVANWEDKATNIRQIQQILNIGMDSIVFLDDNPFERDAVASLIPQITVPDLPDDPAQYVPYLQSLHLFETASHTREAANRAQQYQAEARRIEAQKHFDSYDDYLKDLNMQANALPFDEYHYPRIAQLTQRSNQFNLRTVRYTEADVQRLANDGRYITLYFTLKDKISDYGLISVVVMEKQDEETLFVDTWLMSCRVLKRGMEEFVVNKMIETAKQNGYQNVVGEYIKTPKNAMVEHIYAKLGFCDAGGGRFTAVVDCFTPNNTCIEESKHDK